MQAMVEMAVRVAKAARITQLGLSLQSLLVIIIMITFLLVLVVAEDLGAPAETPG
jgi:hypothetical protein